MPFRRLPHSLLSLLGLFAFAIAVLLVIAGCSDGSGDDDALADDARGLTGATSESACAPLPGVGKIRRDAYHGLNPRLAKLRADGALGSGFFVKTHVVSSVDDIENVLAAGPLPAGHQLVLRAGAWTNARIRVRGRGTASAPVIIRPEGFNRPGDARNVIFRGRSQLVVEGTHVIVYGLRFEDGSFDPSINNTATNTVLHVGDQASDAICNACIVSDSTIAGYRFVPAAIGKTAYFARVWGTNNTIAYSDFRRFDAETKGHMIWAPRRGSGSEPDMPQHFHALYNLFEKREITANSEQGSEVLQIGSSGKVDRDVLTRPSYARVEGNLFRDCEGGHALLTLKGSDVLIRNNTFAATRHSIMLRNANRVLIDENYFLGRASSEEPLAAGVFVWGEDHVITNNYFRDLRLPAPGSFFASRYPVLLGDGNIDALTGDENFGPPRTPSGEPREDVPAPRAKNVFVLHNTFDETESNVGFGYPVRGTRLPVVGATIANNLFEPREGAPAIFEFRFPSERDVLLATNTIASNVYLSPSIGLPNAVQSPTSSVERRDGFLFPTTGGAVQSKARPIAGLPVRRDVLGSTRPESCADIGAIQRNPAPGTNASWPLVASDVGPGSPNHTALR